MTMTASVRLDRSAPLRALADEFELPSAETNILEETLVRRIRVGRREDLIVQGEASSRVGFLAEGWAFAYKLLPDGRRQIIGFLLPGSLVGLSFLLFGRTDFSVATVTDCAVDVVNPDRMLDAVRTHPCIGELMFGALQLEALRTAHQLVCLGRGNARERVATLLIELMSRLQTLERVKDGTFEMPLSQEILADALGLSAVHVNRTLQSLRRLGVITTDGSSVRVNDADRLAQFAGGLTATPSLPRARRRARDIEPPGHPLPRQVPHARPLTPATHAA